MREQIPVDEKGTPLRLIVAVSLASVVLVLLSTSRYGVGISPDSTAYISAARSLLAGEGFRCHDGSLYTAWPPLFPALLATLGLTGIDPATGARFLNAFAFGGIVFASGVFFTRCLRSKAITLVAASSVALCPSLPGISSMAWTEPVFVLLIVLFILQMARFLRDGRTGSLVSASILASLCLMQRYTGVTVAIAGVVLLLFYESGVGLLTRLRRISIFIVISYTPLALWMARNYRLTSVLTGQQRQHSVYPLWTNIGAAADTATRWLLPGVIPLPVRLIVVVGFILLVVVALVLFRGKLPRATERDSTCLWSAWAVTLTYIPLILYTHQAGVLNEPMNDRYLAPLSVLILWLVFVAADRVWLLLALAGPRGPLLQHLVVGLAALWLAYPIEHAQDVVSDRMRNGAGEYARVGWQESPLVKWLREHPLQGSLRSNAPDALYALTGMHALVSPHRTWDIEGFREAVSTDAGPLLIWFSMSPRIYLYDLEELASMFYLEEVATFADGGVYRFVPATACVFGNSRIFSPCRTHGVWSCTFTSDRSSFDGTITSWVLRADGTTDSLWTLRTPAGAVIRWQPSCRYTPSDRAFQFHCDGVATRDASDRTCGYSLDVSGAVDGDAATGTYRIEFADPQWPAGTEEGAWRVDLAEPVHRLCSQVSLAHRYTMSREEATGLSGRVDDAWIAEGVAFYAYPEGRQPPDARPVYRLRSRNQDTQILTADEREKDRLTGDNPPSWTYDGIAFHAYLQDLHPLVTQPVHRFWSRRFKDYFYTASEAERQTLLEDPSQGWTYEGIAWYAVRGP